MPSGARNLVVLLDEEVRVSWVSQRNRAGVWEVKVEERNLLTWLQRLGAEKWVERPRKMRSVV